VAEKRTRSGAGPESGSAKPWTVGAPGEPPSIVYVPEPTAPTLPATSVARCSSVCEPLPEIVTGAE
jgi:hypothetical protein